MQPILSHSRVTIVGLGQLGGSLAMRLRDLGCAEIYGVTRSRETLDRLLDTGTLDHAATDPHAILPITDICFLCMPLTASVRFVEENIEHFRPGSIVTDVGSVKGSIVAALRPMLAEKGVAFVGSHPMAGTELSGIDSADPKLYDGCICFLTPTEADDPDVLAVIRQYWEEIGACVLELPTDRHDAAVAYASHMLHLVSAGLVNTVLGEGDREARGLAAAGAFRDMTRVAGSDTAMWLDICKHNSKMILQAVDRFKEELDVIRAAVAGEQWDAVESFLEQARTARQEWPNLKLESNADE